MEKKDFFEKITDKILNECNSEDDFIAVYDEIQRFKENHKVTKDDMMNYINSGAAEVLALATQDYRDMDCEEIL